MLSDTEQIFAANDFLITGPVESGCSFWPQRAKGSKEKALHCVQHEQLSESVRNP